MKEKAYFHTIDGGKEITFKESVGQLVFVGILYAIGYTCFFVALLNLFVLRPLPLSGLLSSVAWIAIFLSAVVSGCRKNGTRQHFVNVLGHFIRNRFAQFMSDDAGGSILCFGYRCGTRRYYFLKLRPNGINSVDWGPGQGNNPVKDNDWNVAMWFETASIVFDGTHDGLGIFIVGPSGHKAGREAFGNGFIDFLKANQVQLTLPPKVLLGQSGDVVEPLHPMGRIRVGTDEYAARPLERMIKKGSKVVIEEIRGTSIYVRQRNGPNQASEVTARKLAEPQG
ncbi:MAG: NfeD family protein [Lentisphaeria bacterium]